MAYNNTVTLIGNTGSEIRINQTEEGKSFATVSLATKDSYKDDAGNWQETETIWHNLIAFNPTVVKALEAFKKGTRLKVTGTLSYRPFTVQLEDGRAVTKNEASIVVKKVEQAPLAKKDAA